MLFNGVYILNKNPMILAFWGTTALQSVKEFLRQHPKRPVYVLMHNPWYQATLPRMLKMKYVLRQLQRLGAVPLQFSNSGIEDIYRKRFGIAGTQCLPYIYCCENEFAVEDTSMQYNAVYAAQMSPFKRFFLASQVERLFVMTYRPRQRTGWNLHRDFPEVKHADYNTAWITPEERNWIYNRSGVGLCLSQEEGPMLASVEYMLNGLPVVSTVCKGGREEYYESPHCLFVNDTPKSVQEGVNEMIWRNLDRHQIRKYALNRIRIDRERYVSFICDFVHKDCGARLDPDEMISEIFSLPKHVFQPSKEWLQTPAPSRVMPEWALMPG